MKPRRKKPDARGPASALLIVDVLNKLDFPEGPRLLKRALPMARRILRLKQALKRRGVPIIYANDNFGRWRSDRSQIIREAIGESSRGEPIARLLMPDEDDYFVLKPKHSAFFSTTLETLLSHLGTKRLVITGLAGNICVLHTALDAHVREFEIMIPRDCIAANTAVDHRQALRQFRQAMDADTRPARDCVRSLAR